MVGAIGGVDHGLYSVPEFRGASADRRGHENTALRVYRSAARRQQSAAELLLHRPHPPDPAERKNHPHSTQPDRHLLLLLFDAVRLGPAVQLRSRGTGALLQPLSLDDGSLEECASP